MTAREAKTTLMALLDDVELGEVIVITRHGRPVATLAPARGPLALRGRFAGVAVSAARDAELYSTGIRWDTR